MRASWALTFLLLLPTSGYGNLSKTLIVMAGQSTGTTTAWAVTGLTGCTPVPGTTGSMTVAPKHGTVSIQTVSFTTPNCGSAEFSGSEAFYTWTDTTPMPGGGSDYFQVTFNGPPSIPGTTVSDIYICLNFGCKVNPACKCAKEPGETVSNTGEASAGEPIDIGSGNVTYQVTDYQTAGQNPLVFSRTYNTGASITSFAQTLGSNWRSTYDRYIDVVSSKVVSVERGNGQVVPFSLSGTSWTTDADVDISLVQSGNTWTLTDENDTVETYTTKILPILGNAVAIVTPNGAQLTSIKYRNGYTQTMGYSAGNQLTSVTDSYGRTLSFTYSNGLLASVTTPDNTTITYQYGPVPIADIAPPLTIVLNSNKLVSVTYPTSPASNQTYLYENSGLPFALTGVIDESGNRYATWTHDSMGRGLTSQMGMGATLTTVSYDDKTGNRTVTNALGAQETFQFTTLESTVKVSEIDRAATSTTAAGKRVFAYDGNGYLAGQTDWNGSQTTYTNNAHGMPTTINEAVGSTAARTTTIAYDATWVHQPDTIVTPGLTMAFTYDSSGETLTRTLTDTTTTSAPYATKGQARTWTYTWQNHLLSSAQSPNGNITGLTYDGSGALTAITDALGNTTSVTAHTGGGLPLAVVDPNGVAAALSFDARQRLTAIGVTTAAGVLTSTLGWDAAGNLTGITLPDNSSFTRSYDTAHRLTGIGDLLGNSIAYTLDALGDRTETSVADPTGSMDGQHSGVFDALGRLIQDVGGVGQTTKITYDGNGNRLTFTDPLNRVTKRTVDALNRITSITDAAGGVTTIAYDSHNRPVSITDPSGNATKYTYDGFGDAIQQTSPDTGTTVLFYDADGNRVESVDARGVIAGFAFDALDRMVSVTYPGAGAEDVEYTYDEAGHGFGIGRLTSVRDVAGSLSRSYDERGNLVSETRTVSGTGRSRRPGETGGTAPVTLATSYSFDAANRVVAIGYPSGASVSYTRDAMGRVTAVGVEAPGAAAAMPVAANIGYLPFGSPNALTYGNGVSETRNFDLDYRLTALADTGASAVENLTYSYNNANDVTGIADGITAGNSQTFGYDALDRLASASGAYGAFAWTYDKTGNRLTQALAGVTTTYTYVSGSNRLAGMTASGATSVVSYNASGGISAIGSTALTYDQGNRLASVLTAAQSAEYTYDGLGQRIEKQQAASPVSIFQYGPDGRLLEEINNGVSADYIYLDGRPIAELAPATGELYFLHGDRLGTPFVATDANQNVVWAAQYQPFGNTALTVSGSLEQNLRLPGQYFDAETGWNQNGLREYAPGLGRYLQADFFGLFGGINGYAYAASSPANVIDPTGSFGALGSIFGAISGGVGGIITGYAEGGFAGAIGGLVTGAIVGGVIGVVAPELAGEASAAAVNFVVGGLSSYAGQVLGNVSGSITQNGLRADCIFRSYTFSHVNPGAIVGAAIGGAPSSFVEETFAGLDALLAEAEVLTPQYFARTVANVFNGIVGGVSELTGRSWYDIDQMLFGGGEK